MGKKENKQNKTSLRVGDHWPEKKNMVNFVLLKIFLAQTLRLLPSFIFIDMSNETLPRNGGWTHLVTVLPERSSQRNDSMCVLASALLLRTPGSCLNFWIYP